MAYMLVSSPLPPEQRRVHTHTHTHDGTTSPLEFRMLVSTFSCVLLMRVMRPILFLRYLDVIAVPDMALCLWSNAQNENRIYWIHSFRNPSPIPE